MPARAPAVIKVHRIIDNPMGDGSKVHQVGTVTERDGKLHLLVHGMGAIGENAAPKTYKDRAALEKAGWQEGS